MTEVYKCDGCGDVVDSAVEVGYGGNAHMGSANIFYHLCGGCKGDLREWLDNE